MTRLCEIAGCELKHHAKGLCQTHYCKTPEKRQRNKNYRIKNPEKVRAWKKGQNQRYRQRYPELLIALRAKRRAAVAEGLSRFGRIDTRLISNYYTRICGICGLKIENKFEIDHIIPLGKNGTHVLDNLQLAHPLCNRTKRDRLQKDIELDIVILRELVS